MPIYEFLCKKCNAIDEVGRTADRRNDPYLCPDCGDVTTRQLTVPQVITHGEEISYLHPAFGQVMTDRQAKAEAKRRGFIEVGNEDVGKHIDPPKPKDYDEPDFFL